MTIDCNCKPGDIMPMVDGKHFRCDVCSDGLISSCTNVFHWQHDDKYGCLLVCNSCDAEYQSEGV